MDFYFIKIVNFHLRNIRYNNGEDYEAYPVHHKIELKIVFFLPIHFKHNKYELKKDEVNHQLQ